MNSNSLSIDSPEFLHKAAKPGWLDHAARRIVLSKLSQLRHGEVTVIEKDRSQTFGRADDAFPLAVTLNVKSPGFYGDVAFGGAVGAGEAYIQDYWECSDLVSLGRILLRNRNVLDSVDGGAAAVAEARLPSGQAPTGHGE